MHAALHNPEEELRVIVDRRVFAEPIHRTAGPFERVVERVRSLFNGARVRRAFIEGHNDVSADFALGLHDRFRREQMTRAIQMTAEFHALFSNVAKFLQAPNLESAAVREHRAVPAHKLLHAAHLGHKFCARAQIQVIQVIRIRQNDLRLHFAQVPR